MQTTPDDMSSFFENLDPNDFTSTEGAYRIETINPSIDDPNEMIRFVHLSIEAARIYYELASVGHQKSEDQDPNFFLPFAVAHAPTQRRFYRPKTSSQTYGEFFDIVSEDLQTFNPIWFFICMESVVFLGNELDASVPPEEMTAYRENYPHQTAILWYFESIQEHNEAMEYGSISTDGDRTHVVYRGTTEKGVSPHFRKIMEPLRRN